MNRFLVLNLNRIIILVVIGLFLSFFLTTNAFSQDASPASSAAPAAATLTFPIDDLGGCKDLGACTSYCEDPVHYNSCADYAKKNGFYADDVTAYADDEFYEDAQNELGCNSADGCATHCDNPDNADACTDFANQVGLLGGTTTEGPGGCQSGETCSAYCSDPANFSQCSNLIEVGKAVFAGP